MSSRIRKIVYIILVTVAVAVIVICVHNIKTNPANFWEINVFNGLTMLWTIGFSFIVSQSFSRYQRQSDVLLKLIMALSTNLDESKTCQISDRTDSKVLLMQNREISTQIAYIKQYATKFGIKKEIEFIEEKFNEYKTLISDHIDDIHYLSKSQTELSRPIKLISTKLYDIMLKL